MRSAPADDTASNPADDPANRSFMGKVKAFEKMDHLARAKRMLELQEAEQARVCVSLKHISHNFFKLTVKCLGHVSREDNGGYFNRNYIFGTVGLYHGTVCTVLN